MHQTDADHDAQNLVDRYINTHVYQRQTNAQAIHPEETITVDPDTGAEKGTKPARMGLIPTNALDIIARVFGYGSQKYADHNWRKGYKWSLSYDACLRHLNAFWGGEDLDPESGLPHVAHAAWHCMALIAFMEEQPEKDDRFIPITKLSDADPEVFSSEVIPQLSEEEREMLVEDGIISREELQQLGV